MTCELRQTADGPWHCETTDDFGRMHLAIFVGPNADAEEHAKSYERIVRMALNPEYHFDIADVATAFWKEK